RSIWTIMHKELIRVFKSPSMLIALLSPGILIFAMYSFMGSTMPDTPAERALAAEYVIYAVGMPDPIYSMLTHDEFPFDVTVNRVTQSVAQSRIELLESEEVHLVLFFNADFVDNMLNPSPSLEENLLTIYFNPFHDISDFALNIVFIPQLEALRNQVIFGDSGIVVEDMFTLEQRGSYDMRRVMGGILADLIPMMLLIFLFTGCMTITAESIAGEKERGTMSTLLATPTHRRNIAIGKIASLSIIAMISAISSFLGLMLSLPQMLNMSIMTMYGFGEWALIFLILASTVLFIVGAMAVISSFAKNIKEATLWISVLMFVGIGVSMLTMVFGVPTNVFLYLIPLYGTVLSLTAVISFEVIMVNLVVAFAANILYTLGIVWLLTRMFNSERIMFAK
ncbi:MAG: ABC transporter permease subunit, partial [Firmicutes bacterium]|nr:ABC transporter permease subunit [Bacillota bacterium]